MTSKKLIGLGLRRNILFPDAIDLIVDIAKDWDSSGIVKNIEPRQEFLAPGQIKNKILVKLNQHYSSIGNKLERSISKHFQGHKCTEPYPVTIFILS